MSTEASKSAQPVRRFRPPDYRHSKIRLARLRKFQDLLRHYQRWPDDLALARPLDQLIPQGTPPSDQRRMLELEINKLLVIVHRDVVEANVVPLVEYSWNEPHVDRATAEVVREEKKRLYDVITHYYQLVEDHPYHKDFAAIMSVLEQAIGMYEARVKYTFGQLFNPIEWISWLVRLPLEILERAGLDQNDDMHKRAYSIYGWIIRVVFALILLLIAARIGIKVDWKELFSRTVRWVIP